MPQKYLSLGNSFSESIELPTNTVASYFIKYIL